MSTGRRCPRRDHRDCPLCGKSLGWIDLRNPGRKPTIDERRVADRELQVEHDSNIEASKKGSNA